MPITISDIEKMFELQVSHFENLFNEPWRTIPKKVELLPSRTKAKYGLAHSSGVIQISTAFIGTSAYKKLQETICHELTHLFVGLGRKHDRVFKMVLERALGYDFVVPKEEISEIASNIEFKWTVIARLANGTTKSFQVHKKTKRYSEYPSNGHSMSIQGEKILTFVFIANFL